MWGDKQWGRAAQGLAALALALAGLFPGNNPDTFGHLAQGRQIFELGHVPPTDSWSLLPGPPRPWHNYEWLSDVVYYGLYRAWGYDGLIALKCLLLLGTGWLLLSLARRLGGERGVLLGALVLVAAIPAVRIRLSDRPHVFGLCLAAVYLVSLSRLLDAEGPDARPARARTVGLLFVLHVLWINLHGSHLLGVAITVAFAAFSPPAARRYVAALLGLEALASCLSPYGPAIVLDAIGHVADPRYRQLVSEWDAWTVTEISWGVLGPLFQGAALAVVTSRLWRVSSGARAWLAVALLLGVACFRSVRFVAEFMLLTAPLVGAGLALFFSEVALHKLALVCAALFPVLGVNVGIASAKLPPFLGLGHGAVYDQLPQGPGRMLARAAVPARIFTPLRHAWPLMWEAPKSRFFFDGRVPFYGPAHAELANRAVTDPGTLASVLESADITAVVSDFSQPSEQALVESMTRRPGWSISYIDAWFVLFTRDDLSRPSNFPRLEHVRPTVAPEWVLQASEAEQAEIGRELKLVPSLGSGEQFGAWIQALQTLAPLQRSTSALGFRWPKSADEWRRYREAAGLLQRVVKERREQPPIVFALMAMVDMTLCELDAAEAALDEYPEIQHRGTLLTRQEIALRRGDVESVRAFVTAALSMPEGRDDPWVLELQRGLTEAPVCPP